MSELALVYDPTGLISPAHLIGKRLYRLYKYCIEDASILVAERTDTTVVIHWLRDQGSYKVFVENRIKKILSHEFIEWKYVPTKQNLADIGSQGSPISKLGDLWWKDPTWLSNISLWYY